MLCVQNLGPGQCLVLGRGPGWSQAHPDWARATQSISGIQFPNLYNGHNNYNLIIASWEGCHGLLLVAVHMGLVSPYALYFILFVGIQVLKLRALYVRGEYSTTKIHP